MITDKYGQQIYSEKDLLDLYLANPDVRLSNVLTTDKVTFDSSLDLQSFPELIEYTCDNLSVEEFDSQCMMNWHFPEQYKQFDIAEYILSQCKNESELQRAGHELLMFQERNMFVLLQYLKYLVDTMRENNIVWGVGRGSSVASFVLYLIGVHRINSLYYDLSIDEFLK